MRSGRGGGQRRTLIRILGDACPAVGIVAAPYAPYEIHCFYVFTTGGPFEYEGFTVGSLWFALLAVLLVSVLVTLPRYSSTEILSLLEYSPYEHDRLRLFFSVVESINLSVRVAALGVITLGRIASSRLSRDQRGAA